MNVVVGSGPAGMACATALLAQGLPVTLLDAGLEAEAAARERAERLRSTPRAEWDPDVLEAIKAPMRPRPGRVPDKTVLGSDFPYRDADAELGLRRDGIGFSASLAKGGLSNVWGSAILPYREADLAGWPIGFDELEPHYRAVLGLLDVAAERDALDDLFPLLIDRVQRLAGSRQAEGLLADLRRNERELVARGIRFGRSRLAVRAPDCIRCGLCLFGCPFDLIWSARLLVDRAADRPGLVYRKGVVVEHVRDRGSDVRLTVRRLENGREETVEAERVFLAGNPLSTAAIVLASLGLYDRPLSLKDSAYFLLPLLRLRQTPGVVEEELHALAQVFLEIFDDSLGPHPAHLQIYSYNELFADAIRAKLGPLKPLLRPFEGALLGRLLLAQGFLHSDLSPDIRLELKRQGGRRVLHAEPGKDGPSPREPVRRIVRKLGAARRATGTLPLSPLLQIAEPGRGFHCGGTFPMRDMPGELETDRWGRLPGLKRVHLVDASVFPTVPAPTVTLAIMANAHRIGSGRARWERTDG